MIYVLENGVRKPVSRTPGLPVKNNLRKAQTILENRKREYDESGLAGMLSQEERPAKGKSRAQFYTKQEAEKLLECAKGEEIYIPVMLALFYGLRRSEVCGLQWDSIDWENDRIHIDHKAYCDVFREGNPIVITDEMKTESSRRTLPLIPFVKDELLAHKERQEYYRKMFHSGYSKKWLGCVCVDPTGNLIVPDKLTHKFNCLLKNHGLRRIRFRDLRHSCASLLVASGIPLKMVQLYMGHSNYSTTADIYAHLNPEALDRLRRVHGEPARPEGGRGRHERRWCVMKKTRLKKPRKTENSDRAEAREPRVSAS